MLGIPILLTFASQSQASSACVEETMRKVGQREKVMSVGGVRRKGSERRRVKTSEKRILCGQGGQLAAAVGEDEKG